MHTWSTECLLCASLSDMRPYHTLEVLDGRSCPQSPAAVSDGSNQPPTPRTPSQGEGPVSWLGDVNVLSWQTFLHSSFAGGPL